MQWDPNQPPQAWPQQVQQPQAQQPQVQQPQAQPMWPQQGMPQPSAPQQGQWQDPNGWQQGYQQPYDQTYGQAYQQPYGQPYDQTYQQPYQQPYPPQQPLSFDPTLQQPQMPSVPTEPDGKQRKKKKVKRPSGRRRQPIAWWRIALPLLALAGALVFLFRDTLFPKPTTATLVYATYDNGHAGDALIVRNEVAYDDEGVQNVEYVAQEGTAVSRGDPICYVYATGYSTREMTTLQDYRDQIREYQQTLLKSETATDTKLSIHNTDVLQRGLEVRSLVQGARGNLMNQETILAKAITERQSAFRSKYSTDMRLNRLYDDESTQQQRIDSWIRQKIATQESIVSFYTDGFEHALSPSEYEKYTPQQVRSMINGQKPEVSVSSRGRMDLYRLVKDGSYVVLMLVRDSNWNPVEGEVLTLILEHSSETTVDARVMSFTRSGGELLLRLAVMGDVSDVLYLRTCPARVGENVDCYQVPRRALYTQNGTTGVVLMGTEGQAFVPVRVVEEKGSDVFILPVSTGTLTAGETIRLF